MANNFWLQPVITETERLVLREVLPTDAVGMFELDSNPLVHTYVGAKPVQTIEQSQEVIRNLRTQYAENGVARWAVIEKENNCFIGWAGLKYYRKEINGFNNFYDLGYRLIPKYWGKGYATEAGIASLNYGFEKLQLEEIYAMADSANTASVKVLQKCGMQYTGSFDFDGARHDWFEIKKEKA
jgi:ribosomal-protein-alanine N-acetyltransferase